MKPRLACADFTFPLLDHDRVLNLIAMLEFDGVDVGLFEGRSHLWPSHVFVNAADSGRKLGKKLSDRGLLPADIFLQNSPDFGTLALNHPEAQRRQQARDLFERTLEFAVACGTSHVSALPGVNFESESPSDSWGRCCEELEWRCAQAQQAKLVFSVEAHVGSIIPTPAKALQLVNTVPGLTLTLDYTHFVRDGLPDAEVEPLVAHASHFHLRGAKPGRLQCSFKDNVIDYRRVLDVMNDTNYRGYLGIEYVWIDWEHCNEVDNLSETIQWRDFLRTNASIRLSK